MKTRVAWIVPKLTAGGIGPVCSYAAKALSQAGPWQCSVVSIRGPVSDEMDPATGVRFISLGLGEDPASAPGRFLDWLQSNPQRILITNDVSRIEAAFPYLPATTAHVVQIHDSMRRYGEVAIRNHPWIDGVACVANHIREPLEARLRASGFQRPVATVHNGADFPPLSGRTSPVGPLRLLFTGKMDSLLKGILDIVPILSALRRLGVPHRLTIVGGSHDRLARMLKFRRLDDCVSWAGRVPHDQCYRLAGEHDLFLMLSRREPFGMVTIEAMGMGCVPIGYLTPSGTTEIIQSGQSGLLFSLGDTKGIAGAIHALHHDRTRLAELCHGAVLRARTDFGSLALAQRTSDFLRRVLLSSADCAPDRRLGQPPPAKLPSRHQSRLRYTRLPPAFRGWLRDVVGRSPRLSHWLISRWGQ